MLSSDWVTASSSGRSLGRNLTRQCGLTSDLKGSRALSDRFIFRNMIYRISIKHVYHFERIIMNKWEPRACFEARKVYFHCHRALVKYLIDPMAEKGVCQLRHHSTRQLTPVCFLESRLGYPKKFRLHQVLRKKGVVIYIRKACKSTQERSGSCKCRAIFQITFALVEFALAKGHTPPRPQGLTIEFL